MCFTGLGAGANRSRGAKERNASPIWFPVNKQKVSQKASGTLNRCAKALELKILSFLVGRGLLAQGGP